MELPMRPKISPEILSMIVAGYRQGAYDREREAQWWKAAGPVIFGDD
jgi:hypothetical protein